MLDALRAGHEAEYYPGETNLRSADVLVINKVERANPTEVEAIKHRVQDFNSNAAITTANLVLTVDDPDLIAGHRVLVVDDGPTLTHGGMAYGAGFLAAQQCEADEIIDPREGAVGSIAEAFAKYPHVGRVLPALGYSKRQCSELETTIHNLAPEAIVDASPARLDRVVETTIPIARVKYRFQQVGGPSILGMVHECLDACLPAEAT